MFTAGDLGHIKVFTLPVPPTPSSSQALLLGEESIPVALTELHAASNAHILPGGRLLYTASSLVSPKNAYLLTGLNHPDQPLELKQITFFGKEQLEDKNLDPGEEFWFAGAHDIQVHGFALKPKGWREGEVKKYPAVLLIHGGPQGAWEDGWSTRWNPNGLSHIIPYIKILSDTVIKCLHTKDIIPSSSIPLGVQPTDKVGGTKCITLFYLSIYLDFTDAITEDWGGRPFKDLVLGWKYVLERYPEVQSTLVLFNHF